MKGKGQSLSLQEKHQLLDHYSYKDCVLGIMCLGQRFAEQFSKSWQYVGYLTSVHNIGAFATERLTETSLERSCLTACRGAQRKTSLRTDASGKDRHSLITELYLPGQRRHDIRGNLSASVWRPLSLPPCPYRNALSYTPGPARWPGQVPKKVGRNARGQEKKCPQAQLIQHRARSWPFSLNPLLASVLPIHQAHIWGSTSTASRAMWLLIMN